jgi:hypothetical protein
MFIWKILFWLPGTSNDETEAAAQSRIKSWCEADEDGGIN